MRCPNRLRCLWREITITDFHILHIELKRVATLTTMPLHHRDPFDRLLIAQAMVEQLPIVSDDTAFDAYSVTPPW
jgi:PIN domain nuclease of toxin-antitoxin system